MTRKNSRRRTAAEPLVAPPFVLSCLIRYLSKKFFSLGQLWLFIIAPLIGAAIAAAVYAVTHRPPEPISVRAAERALESEQAERRS